MKAGMRIASPACLYVQRSHKTHRAGGGGRNTKHCLPHGTDSNRSTLQFSCTIHRESEKCFVHINIILVSFGFTGTSDQRSINAVIQQCVDRGTLLYLLTSAKALSRHQTRYAA